MRLARLLACLLVAAFAPKVLRADTVTVVTSFPKELTEAYKKAYEAKNPGTTLEILNKGTSAGIAYVRESAAGNKPDIFWVSAPDAFEVLAKEKLLEKLPDFNATIPAKIGDFPVNDPHGFYKGRRWRATASCSTRATSRRRSAGAKGMGRTSRSRSISATSATCAPSRSGTTQLTVETILQGEGWENGWAADAARSPAICADDLRPIYRRSRRRSTAANMASAW